MKVAFIDSTHPSLKSGLEHRGFVCDDLFLLSKESCLEKLIDYSVWVIRSRFKITKEIIDQHPQLKIIARVGAGMENIDVAYAESKGIKCLHAPEGNRDAVAEQAIGMLLMLFNYLKRADNEVRQGIWKREENRGIELSGKTVGIIGYGNTGSAFAKKLSGFDCEILAYDKYKKDFSNTYVKETDLVSIFEKADIISLHIPYNAETEYLVNSVFIQSFKKPIYIINTSRGKCLNTADLVKALQSGKVKGACLDVLEYEVTSFEQLNTAGLPEPFQYLIQSDNVILSPHIAGWTHESNEKMAKVLVEKIMTVMIK
jgi:D-3-phosphoglycerate dehydrogenase / 2-oxoglutarate reductase